MTVFKKQITFLFLSVLLISCAGNNSSQLNADSPDSSIKKQGKEFKFSFASLYVIDGSIYNEQDTTWDFKDGTHAYENMFHGGGFIDSLGKPLHSRYKKYDLTNEQTNLLKDSFVYKLCNSNIHTCTPIYRDVLIFYDSLKQILAQAPICFGCREVLLYPRMDKICEPKKELNFKSLQDFIASIKSN